ncbi:preprotein translocase subunit SecE [Catelliglobosispora koreensis]|uniref:preprotein translocase subunit SecE n=1 Tax=Catelliglobosispora koreensis TaxID=129052 RepID=UPI000379B8AE|nr:preprotein translocase subunit SecE [Catelliglobosispora koreensis]
MADKNRRGDEDAADHGLDDVFDDAIDDDAELEDDDDTSSSKSGGGTAVKSRKSEKTERSGGGGPFGKFGRFIREIISELRKVIWPTRKELLTYTAVVVVFVVVMLAIVGTLDFLYAKGVLFVFGNQTTAE